MDHQQVVRQDQCHDLQLQTTVVLADPHQPIRRLLVADP